MAHFQYDPPSGPISGVSFEDQTELAINDLHSRVDETNTNTSEAKDTADQALASASEAKQAAALAQTSADEAKTQITQVRNDLTSTTVVANNAMIRANNAFDLAATAQSQAGQVTTGLSNHIADHNNPHAVTAEQVGAYSTIETDSRISSLVPSIEAAMGKFRTETEDADVNTLYDVADKIYLTGAGTTNLPPDITIPAWLMVYINEGDTAVTQRIWDSSSTHLIYERTGTINNSDPNNPVVAWTPWNTIASPTVVKSVTVEVDPAGQPAGTYLVFVMETSSGDVTTYVNLSQVTGGGYTSGNGAIDISADNKISLKLDPSNSSGLLVSTNGLQTLPAVSAIDANPATGQRGLLYPDGVTIKQTSDGMLSVPGGGGDVAAAIAEHNADVDAHTALFGLKIRRKLSSNTNYYVSQTGNNSNNGTSSSTAFLTMSRIIDELTRIDGNGFDLTINLGAGTWPGITFYPYACLGIRSLILNGGGIGNTIISSGSSNGITTRSGGGFETLQIKNISFDGANNGIQSSFGHRVLVESLSFNNISITSIASTSGVTLFNGPISVEGTSRSFISAQEHAYIWIPNVTSITMVNTPSFTNTIQCFSHALIAINNATFSGSSTGSRYLCDVGGTINTYGRGANYIPGSSAGTTSGGGQYI